MRHNGGVTPVYAIAAILIVVAIALAAVGRLGGLPDTTPDRPPLDFPEGPVTAAAVDDVTFAVGLRGYRMDEVDTVLDRVADDLAARDERINQLERTLADQGLPIPPTHVDQPQE